MVHLLFHGLMMLKRIPRRKKWYVDGWFDWILFLSVYNELPMNICDFTSHSAVQYAWSRLSAGKRVPVAEERYVPDSSEVLEYLSLTMVSDMVGQLSTMAMSAAGA